MLVKLLIAALSFATAGCAPKKTMSEALNSNTIDFAQSISSKADFMKLVGQVSGSEPMVKLTVLKNSGDIYYQNTGKYSFHLNFLKDKLPNFKTLTMTGFEQLIFSEPPSLLAGAVYWLDAFEAPDLPSPGAVGFNIYFATKEGSPAFNPEYVALVHKRMSETISYPPEKIIYFAAFDSPQTFLKQKILLSRKGIKSYPITAILGKSDKPRVYNPGKSYGYLRSISPAEIEAGHYTSKDILLFDEVPIDIGPIAGVISSRPQVPHSHVIFRATNLKIPNIFIPNARSLPGIVKNVGKLVEVSATQDGDWSIRGENEIPDIETLAKNYFEKRIPALPNPRANLKEFGFFNISNIAPTASLTERYGSKGTNFAILDTALRAKGIERSFTKGAFLIPYSFNAEHMSNKISNSICQKASEKCSKIHGSNCEPGFQACTTVADKKGSLRDFAFTIASPSFTTQMLSNGGVRKASLEILRYTISKTEMIPEHLTKIKKELSSRWEPKTRIRFRSSSNAEDLPGLTGAGLYSSHSGCMADEGITSVGSSACATQLELSRTRTRIAKLRDMNDPKLANIIVDLEKSITDKDPVADAVRKVFASLWNERAFLSRDYYGIPHDKIYMGLLVHPSFSDDSANGVAIVEEDKSGIRADIVVQIDDVSITNPETPGAIPEEVILTTSGGLKDLKYISRSNQIPEGATVLTPTQLEELLKQLKIIFETFHSSGLNTTGRMDIEFKRNAQGQIQIKQMRAL
ncbi:MAG: hypothetical protein RL189_2704 [Pseudomonadota bacterium]|jgi:hypothetical protein